MFYLQDQDFKISETLGEWNIFSPNIEEDSELIQEMTLAILVADTRLKERLDLPDYQARGQGNLKAVYFSRHLNSGSKSPYNGKE